MGVSDAGTLVVVRATLILALFCSVLIQSLRYAPRVNPWNASRMQGGLGE
jgi:low affinity Fe/Cu permease